MNIKGLVAQVGLLSVPKPSERKPIRSSESTDRDADGRRQPKDETPIRLTEEEFLEAVEKLKSHEGVMGNDLQIEIDQIPTSRIVKLLDPSGKVIKRFTENELWLLTRHMNLSKGGILDKAG